MGKTGFDYDASKIQECIAKLPLQRNFLIRLGYKGMFIVADGLHSSNSLAVLAMFSNSSSTVSLSLIFAKRVKSGFIIFSCYTFFSVVVPI